MRGVSHIINDFVTSTDLAKLLGLSVRRIQQLTADGVLPATDKEHGRKYCLVDAVQAYVKSVQTKTDNSSAKSRILKLQEEKLAAEVELKQSQGELHQLKTQIAQGKYISVEEAQIEYQKFFVVFKKFAAAIAPRVGGIVAVHVDPVVARAIEKNVATDINEQLRNFVFSAGGASAKPAGQKKTFSASKTKKSSRKTAASKSSKSKK